MSSLKASVISSSISSLFIDKTNLRIIFSR
jgi:hypothetical protein